MTVAVKAVSRENKSKEPFFVSYANLSKKMVWGLMKMSVMANVGDK